GRVPARARRRGGRRQGGDAGIVAAGVCSPGSVAGRDRRGRPVSSGSLRLRVQATRQATRTAARMATASSKPPSGTRRYPLNATLPRSAERRPNQEKRVTKTATSANSNAPKSHGLGSASANQGRSQRLYCGE